MFKSGDTVVYGQAGVCTIADICEKELVRDQKKLYYVIKPLFQQNNIIYAPVENKKVNIRPVMTRQEADKLILKIPEIKAQSNVCELTQEECKKSLSSMDCTDVLKLTMLIYQKKKTAESQKKRLGFSDGRYMQLAEDILFGELSFVLDIPREKIKDYIEEKLKSSKV